MQDVLSNAIAMHQAGQLGSAAQAYLSLLAAEPDNADALHLLGVLHHQQGDHACAVEEIGRAVALRPSVPIFHVNLAEVYRTQSQFDRAAGCCRTALRLSPNHPDAHCNLGLALQGLSRHAEAVEEFRLALNLRSDFSLAHNNLGVSLRELGRFDEALMHFRRAVELAPDQAQARTNLGQMLVDTGNAEEALPHCREAVRLQPNLAALHHNLGNALKALGQSLDAKAAYLEAIRLDPDSAQSHARLGLVLQQEGKLGDALVWLEQTVEMKPEDGTFWEYLAELHMEREDYAEAIPCWRRVLDLKPKRAAAHHKLGCALQEEGQSDEAEEHFHEALRLQPSLAAAQLSLAGLREERGNLIEAESAIREAMRLQPAFAIPHGRLAVLLRGRLPEADLTALQERLADPQLGDGPRARLLFGLAHVLDARGDYPAAAACLDRANALTLEDRVGHKPKYDPAEHEKFVDRLLQTFGSDFFSRTAGMGLSTRRPVFVFGLPRSGTTLVEQVLASHSQVHGAGELRLARETWDSIPNMLGRSGRPIDCLDGLDQSTIQRLAQQHESHLTALAGGLSERIVDKMPDNYMHLGFLAALFPQASFIHCRRDLRDVAVSCWMTDFRSIPWANDIEHIATRFHQYRRLTEHWHKVMPVPILEVQYEETVADLEKVARRLVQWCGLPWEPACLRFHETQRPIRTASVTQVRQPIYGTSVARWKNYETALADLFAALPL
jgi:tetratricopeptide (TPR) repeat protein